MVDYYEAMANCYTKLFCQEWEGKAIWEHFADGNPLTCVPAIKGTEYENSTMRLMYVGRTINAWNKIEFPPKTTIDEKVRLLLGNPGTSGYTLDFVPKQRSSGFWKLLKMLLYQSGDATDDKLRDGFPGEGKWHQKIVWSNLYKIAPQKGGNPSFRMIKPVISQYIDLIEAEIKLYKPRVVLFVTDQDWLNPWKNEPSFTRLIRQEKTEWQESGDDIVLDGTYDETKMIVCKRPDRWGMSNEDIKRMAGNIFRLIQKGSFP